MSAVSASDIVKATEDTLRKALALREQARRLVLEAEAVEASARTFVTERLGAELGAKAFDLAAWSAGVEAVAAAEAAVARSPLPAASAAASVPAASAPQPVAEAPVTVSSAAPAADETYPSKAAEETDARPEVVPTPVEPAAPVVEESDPDGDETPADSEQDVERVSAAEPIYPYPVNGSIPRNELYGVEVPFSRMQEAEEIVELAKSYVAQGKKSNPHANDRGKNAWRKALFLAVIAQHPREQRDASEAPRETVLAVPQVSEPALSPAAENPQVEAAEEDEGIEPGEADWIPSGADLPSFDDPDMDDGFEVGSVEDSDDIGDESGNSVADEAPETSEAGAVVQTPKNDVPDADVAGARPSSVPARPGVRPLPRPAAAAPVERESDPLDDLDELPPASTRVPPRGVIPQEDDDLPPPRPAPAPARVAAPAAARPAQERLSPPQAVPPRTPPSRPVPSVRPGAPAPQQAATPPAPARAAGPAPIAGQIPSPVPPHRRPGAGQTVQPLPTAPRTPPAPGSAPRPPSVFTRRG